MLNAIGIFGGTFDHYKPAMAVVQDGATRWCGSAEHAWLYLNKTRLRAIRRTQRTAQLIALVVKGFVNKAML